MEVFVDNLWNAVALLNDKDQAKKFFSDLLTHTEIIMLAKRIQIAKMLIEGNDYQTIMRVSKVTPGTISHINNVLHTRGKEFREIVKMLIDYESQQKNKLEGNIQKIVPAGPYRMVPDLIDAGLSVTAKKIRQSRKKGSIKVQSLK
jgi:TrpR-related protein YerC/YecD